jgi:plastocyanin
MLNPRYSPVFVLLLGTIAGCGSHESARSASAGSDSTAGVASAGSPVTVIASDYKFDAPDQLPAGPTTIKLVNQGKELHHAQLLKLEDGKTVQDLAAAAKQQGPPPPWIKFEGGPNAVPPGKESTATVMLEPGNYAWVCFVYGPDKVMHVAKGMVRPLEVTNVSQAAAKELPSPDVTIKMADYGFQPSQPLTAGHHTILVQNAGPQPHELALLRLAPGKTIKDFGVWADNGMKGPPPAEPIGGVALLDKGGEATFEADLTPGEYGLICFVPDSKDGKPHFEHGMVRTIKVS